MTLNPSAAREQAHSFLESTKLPSTVQCEVCYQGTESRSIAWADGSPNLQQTSTSEGVCVRVLENHRHGMVTTRSMDQSRFEKLAGDALNIARATQPDPDRSFARPSAVYPSALKNDESLFSKPLDRHLSLLSDLEKRILRVDGRVKKVVKLAFTEVRSIKALVNSHGTNLGDESSASGFSVEVLAEDGGQTEVAWDFQSRRFSNDWNLEPIAEAAARHAAGSLGGKPLPSGKYAVVVSPRVGTQLLDLAADALSADAVQNGRSFFRGRLNKRVAAPSVTLIDDPLTPEGVASAPFDGEGTPHQRLTMVSAGTLENYFYDLRSAAKDGRASNGHGMKESLGALPRPGSTNFYMAPGASKASDMLASAVKVFLLKDVMGLHMADPITGEFSLGASGELYENGKFSRPVRGVTIASNIAAMLEGVSAVADDLTWYGSTGAPSFLLPQITIAGN